MHLRNIPIISEEDLIDEYGLKLPVLWVNHFVGNYSGVPLDGVKFCDYSNYKSPKTPWCPRVLELQNASFIGGVWCLYSIKHGYRINFPPLDYSHRLHAEHYTKYFNTHIEPNKQRIKGRTLLLSAQWSTEYYHFVWETLQKLFYADKVIGLKNIDQIIIGETDKPYIREWFKFLNYDDSKLKYVKPDQDYTCDVLYLVPQITRVGSVSYQFCNFLEERLAIANLKKTPSKEIIYIQRKRRRILVNEQRLLKSLNFNNYIEIVNLESLPLFTQLQIFSNAKIIISPHGASFANKLITKAKSVEIISHNSHNTCYLNHSAQYSIDHYYVMADSRDYNLHISPSAIEAISNNLKALI